MDTLSKALETAYNKVVQCASDDVIVTVILSIFALLLLKGFSKDTK